MKIFGNGGVFVILLLFWLAGAMPAAAQKNKDKQKQQKTDSSADAKPILAPDPQMVDQAIGEFLGYWQIGDVDSMHKYFSDEVVVVSGLWEPPVVGWDSYVKAYQVQRARVTGSRMDRTNTLIKVDGNTAWATYQFYYVANVDGSQAAYHGHTTLILNKRGDRWVIVLNHSSIVPEAAPPNPAPVAGPAGSGRP
jgi:ketosteroid isomerase-like protein